MKQSYHKRKVKHQNHRSGEIGESDFNEVRENSQKSRLKKKESKRMEKYRNWYEDAR